MFVSTSGKQIASTVSRIAAQLKTPPTPPKPPLPAVKAPPVQPLTLYTSPALKNMQVSVAASKVIQTIKSLPSPPVPMASSVTVVQGEGNKGYEKAIGNTKDNYTTKENGKVVPVNPLSKEQIDALNKKIEEAKIDYINAEARGDTKAMQDATNRSNAYRDQGGTLASGVDTAVTAALRSYYQNNVTVKAALSKRDELSLNKAILVAKTDVQNAPVNSAQWRAAVEMSDNMRALGGTLSSSASLADAKKTVAALEEKKYQDANRIEIPPKPMGQPVGRKPQPGDQEIIDHVRGFILGTGKGLGRVFSEVISNTLDPVGMGVKAVEAVIDTAVFGWELTTDTKNTVNQIKLALADFKKYYDQASTEEKGLIEGELSVTLAFIVQNKKVIIRNGKLAGSTHPVTGVPFDLKGFPIFESKFDAQLDESLFMKSDALQFKEANRLLYAAIQKDKNLAAKFTKRELEELSVGMTPTDYVWHHHQDPGKMQLVQSNIHSKTGHTGGKALWGGGSENR